MRVSVVTLPSLLTAADLHRAIVVLDVLRATTSMAAALYAGVSEIRVFDSLKAARLAASAHTGPHLLCGESRCLTPPGFDLGNSPGAFTAQHTGHLAFMATTNGTRAIVAAQSALRVFAAALVNARATAQALASAEDDATLLCAGTNGEVAPEDVLGAGAVIAELSSLMSLTLDGETAQRALREFQASRDDLFLALSDTQGGRNVIEAGLDDDIRFAARLNSIPLVAAILSDPLRVVAAR